MSSSLLERARSFHEDAETYEMAIVKQLEQRPRTNKERIYQQHRINNLLTQVVGRNDELDAIYEDKDGSLKREIASMRGKDALRNFYERAKSSWNYHARYPDLHVKHGPDIEKEMEPMVTFSGEELFGKFFDLHIFHTRWINMPQCENKRLDYGSFLSSLNQFGDIPEKSKRSKSYASYLHDLEEYLIGFLSRTQPLVDSKDIISECKAEFDKAWQSGKVKGWTSTSTSTLKRMGESGLTARHLDLSLYHSAEDLMPLGLERLKEALEMQPDESRYEKLKFYLRSDPRDFGIQILALSLKCGGTLSQRAERLMAVKGKKPSEIDPKLIAKDQSGQKRNGTGQLPATKKQNNGGIVTNGTLDDVDWRRDMAFAEAKIGAFIEALNEVLEATRKQVDKKQMRSVEERDAEIADEEAGVLPDVLEGEEEESDDEGPIYNPLNLPLGWDGKPIPFWLYKLHGLGVEFKCEICGDFSYWGRRAFDRHFQEWRHAHGMRCLGIPNTKHFHDITHIQDALDLYSKLRGNLQVEQWVPEAGEEFEDSEGNVLNRRTYEDLARQGLL